MTSNDGPSSVPEPAVDDDVVDADNEGLSWGESDDTSYVDPTQNALTVRRSRDDEDDDVADLDGSSGLVGYGVFGGIYLLFTVAWIIGSSSGAMAAATGVLPPVLRVLALVASPAWFVATVWLAKDRSTRTTFLWLAIGLLLLIPWPFVLTRSF